MRTVPIPLISLSSPISVADCLTCKALFYQVWEKVLAGTTDPPSSTARDTGVLGGKEGLWLLLVRGCKLLWVSGWHPGVPYVGKPRFLHSGSRAWAPGGSRSQRWWAHPALCLKGWEVSHSEKRREDEYEAIFPVTLLLWGTCFSRPSEL